MQTYELDAWLGEARTSLTDDQYATLARIADTIEARYPDPDDAELAAAALSGAVQVMLQDATLVEAGGDLVRARMAEREAMARLSGMLLAAREAGTPETAMALQSGVTRMTVRKALGK